MILNAIAEKLKRQSKDDFKGRYFEASLLVQAVERQTIRHDRLEGEVLPIFDGRIQSLNVGTS